MELVIGHRRYETTKIEQFNQMIKHMRGGTRDESRDEVHRLFNQRKVLELEAFRLSQIMQDRIDSMLKADVSAAFNE